MAKKKAKEEKKVQKEVKEKVDYKAKSEETDKKYLLLYSDFENFRKRTQNEKIKLVRLAAQDLIKSLLPVLDDLERSMKYNEEDASNGSGIDLVKNKFLKILEQNGLKELETLSGDDFDITKHEAVTKIPAEEDKKGKVVDILEKGYELNDEIIRYTKVVIGE